MKSYSITMPANTNEQNLWTLLTGVGTYQPVPNNKVSYLEILTPTGNTGTVGLTDGAGTVGKTAAASSTLLVRQAGVGCFIDLKSITLKGSAASQGIVVTMDF